MYYSFHRRDQRIVSTRVHRVLVTVPVVHFTVELLMQQKRWVA